MATLESLNFPILPSGQMNPFHQALSSGLDTYQNMVKTAYAPMSQEADILSKSAYATNLPYQVKASILQNPYAVASLYQSGQLDDFIKGFSNVPTNPLEAMGSFFKQDNKSNSGSFLNSLASGLGLNKNTSPDQLKTSDNNYAYDKNGNNITASPSEINQKLNEIQNNRGNPATTPIPMSNQYNVPQGTSNQPMPSGMPQNPLEALIAKNMPLTPQGITAAAGAESAKEEAKETALVKSKSYQDYMNNTYAQTKAAINTENALKDFLYEYDKATLKGPLTANNFTRWLSTLDPNTQAAMNASNNIVLAAAPALIGGKQTDLGRALVKNAKVTTEMLPESVHHIVNNQMQIMDRMIEIPSFNQLAHMKYGINDVNQLQNDFIEYYQKYPIISKEGKLQPQNAGKYDEFLAEKYGGEKPVQKNNISSVSKIRTYNPTTGRIE